MSVLPLDDIVKISINLSPRAAVRSGFNLALIVGPSSVISPSDRVKVYSGTDAMMEDGFTAEMPEYKAAALFFMQSSGPSKLAVGRWDNTDGEAPMETLLEAVRDCRAKNRDWYICIPLDATAQQVKELAAYVESVTPATVLFYTTEELTLLEDLKKLNYRRSFGQYSKTANAVAGIAGWAMGANTGLSNSAFTLAYKTVVGVPVDDLDGNTVEQLQKLNANYYVNRGAQYDLYERGTMADGTWFDEILNLDMLANELQLSAMDLLNSMKKVPQTEGGMNLLKSVLIEPLEKFVRMGFLAGGIWKGAGILNLQTGDAIENGYLIQSEPVDEQPQADRDARMAPPIYIALKLAGAVHTVVIQADVNR